MKTYRKLSLFLFLFISIVIQAQEGSLTGNLINQKKEVIPFATVAVLELPDSTLVTGATTDMQGDFNLKSPDEGNYVLRFSAIGFQSTFTEKFEVDGPIFNQDFGVVIMPEEVTMLSEVMVQSWKPRVAVEPGKLVMKVEGTAMAAGSTAFEMLSKAPGVSVGQSGNFMINGKDGVSVMLDGRRTFLSAGELKAFLESMPAENIEEIEVVHNPSSKYDAEGAAGILNIKLKKNTSTGFSGSAYGGFETRNQQLFNGGINLNYQKGNWNSFANIDISERGLYRDMDIRRTFPQTSAISSFHQRGRNVKEHFIPSLQIGTDYELNENHQFGIMANLTGRRTEMDWNTFNRIGNKMEDEFLEIDSKNHSSEELGTGRINLHYKGKLDTTGTQLSADMDYVRLSEQENSDFTNHYIYPSDGSEQMERLENFSNSAYDIYSAKVDLSTPLNNSSQLEFGLKSSRVVSESDLEFFQFVNGTRIFDPERSDKFRYEEEIYAAYAAYSNRLNDRWNLQLGLRAEKTIGSANFGGQENQIDVDYFNFFPNLLVEQKVNEDYKLNYSYSRRISRPAYSLLNPRSFYLDPYTYVVGNPDLIPPLTHSFKLSQTYRKFHLMLGYDMIDKYISEVPDTNPETGETELTQRNIDGLRSYTASLVAPFELASFWSVDNTLVMTQQDFEIKIGGEEIQNKNLYYMLQSNHRINLPLNLKMELNAMYRGPIAEGLYSGDPLWGIDVGLQRSFLNERLNITLKATDIFRSKIVHANANYLGNTFNLEQYFDERALSINLRYTFSKGGSKDQQRQKSLEELNRAGGN